MQLNAYHDEKTHTTIYKKENIFCIYTEKGEIFNLPPHVKDFKTAWVVTQQILGLAQLCNGI